MPINSAPKVSVVIPSYKGVGCVMNAVHSVAAQTYQDFETIVVIDGSNDGTQELLECYKATLPEDKQDRFRILTQDNAGVSAARNNGMNVARGEFIALLDHDDKWYPEKLAAQMAAIEKHPGKQCIFCTTDEERHNKTGNTIKPKSNAECLKSLTDLHKHTGPQPSTWLFSKNIVTKIGGFDEKMAVAEDGDFLIRMLGADGIARINVEGTHSVYNMDVEGSLSSSLAPLTPKKRDSFLRGFEKHHDTLKAELPKDMYDRMMDWHKSIIPADMLDQAMQRLEARQAETRRAKGDSVAPAKKTSDTRPKNGS